MAASQLRQVTKKGLCGGKNQSPFVSVFIAGRRMSTSACSRSGDKAAWSDPPCVFAVDEVDDLTAVEAHVDVRDQPTDKVIGVADLALSGVPLGVDHPVALSLTEPDGGGDAGKLAVVLHVEAPRMPRMLDNKYKCTKLLGSGAFGAAVLAKSDVDDQQYAIKLIKCPDEAALNEIKQEAKVLFPMSHPNIVRYFASFLHTDFEGKRNFAMVMEYCPHGTLWDILMRHRQSGTHFNDGQLALWLYELASALAYVHSCGVLHRDLVRRGLVFFLFSWVWLVACLVGCVG